MLKIKSRKNLINNLVASFENAEVVEQAMCMDEDEANTNMINQDIADTTAEIVSIENHIDAAMEIVGEDSALAEYAEARAGDADDVPSMEAFVIMLNDYNNRSKRLYSSLGEGTVSLEAAEEFDAGDAEGKKGKLKELASAAGQRVKDVVMAIINGIKDLFTKLNNLRKDLFDKAVKLTKQGTELKSNISDDKSDEKTVKTSRAAKQLMVNGVVDPKNVDIVQKNIDTIKDYSAKLVKSVDISKPEYHEEDSFFLSEIIGKKVEMTGNWKTVKNGDQDVEILEGIMPGDIALTRTKESFGEGESASEFYSYKFTKMEDAKQLDESMQLMNKSQREEMVDKALELVKSVTEAKSAWHTEDEAIKNVKEYLESFYKYLSDDKKEVKGNVNRDIKAIKSILNNVRSTSSDLQKYCLREAEAILDLVREHDKVAAGSKAEEKPAEEK